MRSCRPARSSRSGCSSSSRRAHAEKKTRSRTVASNSRSDNRGDAHADSRGIGVDMIQADLIVEGGGAFDPGRKHPSAAAGAEMRDLGILRRGALAVRRARSSGSARRPTCYRHPSAGVLPVIDAGGKTVMPAWWTRTRISSSREAARTSSPCAFRARPIRRLPRPAAESIRPWPQRARQQGRPEGRRPLHAGHDARARNDHRGGQERLRLDLVNEIKMLEVIRELDEAGPMTLVPTFMGAHEVRRSSGRTPRRM